MSTPAVLTSKIPRAEVRRMAFEMARSGATPDVIAEQFARRGFAKTYHSPKQVSTLLDEVFGSLPARDIERVRDIELARLDRMQLALWPSATAGETAAVSAVLKIMVRRAKLLGLDAPTQISGPDGGPMQLEVVEHARESLDARLAALVERLSAQDAAGEPE